MALISFTVKAQVYPYLQKNTTTNRMEVVFTIEQGNTINNIAEMMNQTDSLIKKYEISDSLTVLIVDKNKSLITKMDLRINTLTLQLANRDETIKSLNVLIENYEKSNKLCEDELNKTKKELKRQKFLTKVGFITSSVLLVTTLTLFIAK